MEIGRRKYALGLLAVVAGGALAMGCGSGGDPPPATASLSPSEYFAKANAICRPADQSIEAAAQKDLGSGGPPTAQEFRQFATASVIPETQKVIDALKGLNPPRAVIETRDDLIAELQSVNDRLKANPTSLAEHGDPFAKANQLAVRAGLGACTAD